MINDRCNCNTDPCQETCNNYPFKGVDFTAEEINSLLKSIQNKVDRGEVKDGLSAYKVAVANGYTGTEEQWLASLRGPKGSKFNFNDFTPEEIKQLQQPAIDAGNNAQQQANLAAEKAGEAERQAAYAKEQGDNAQQQATLAEQNATLAAEKAGEAERQAAYAKEQGDLAVLAGEKVTNEVLFKTSQALSEEEQAQVKQNIGINIPISGLERLDWEEGRLGVVSNDSSDTGKMTSPSIPKSSYVICLLNVQGEDITLFVAPSEFSNNLPYYHFNSAIKQYGVTIQGNVLDDNSDFMNIQFTLNNLSDSAITLRCNNLYYETKSKNDLFKGQFSTPEELDMILGKKGAYAYVGNPRHLYDWDNGWVDRGEFVTDVDTVLNDTSEKAIANKTVAAKFSELSHEIEGVKTSIGEIGTTLDELNAEQL